MPHRYTEDKQFDLFSSDPVTPSSAQSDESPANRIEFPIEVQAANDSVRTDLTVTPLSESIINDADAPELIRRLKIVHSALLSVDCIRDSNFEAFEKTISTLDEYTKKDMLNLVYTYDPSGQRYAGAHEGNEHKVLLFDCDLDSLPSVVLLGFVLVSLNSIRDKADFDSACKRCERLRHGLGSESGYKRALTKEQIEGVYELVGTSPTLRSISERLDDKELIDSTDGNVKGFILAFRDLTRPKLAVNYEPLLDSEFDVQDESYSCSKYPIQVFKTRLEPEEPEGIHDGEASSYVTCAFRSKITSEDHVEYIEGGFDEKEFEEFEENFALETVRSLEFQTDTVTSMSNRIINPVSREFLNEKLTSLASQRVSNLSGEAKQEYVLDSVLFLALAMGLPFDLILESGIGRNQRLSKDGYVRRHIRYPESRYEPPESIRDEYIPTTDKSKILLPEKFRTLIKGLVNLGMVDTTFEAYLGMDQQIFLRFLKRRLEKIADDYCIDTIAIDAIPHQMQDWLASSGLSKAMVYWLVGKPTDRPPTKAHYDRVDDVDSDLGAIYRSALDDYFSGEVL